ncbi:MAG TPA: hypothetical protein PK530_03000, partial [Anaerolineales bacterium]|nr:hypothetical protein [Anaerolineales bacterium]
MKTNWKRWLLISVLAFGILVILDARVNITASGKPLSVEVSDPVIPTILPPISEWNEYTGEVVLNTEINPRLNATGIIYDGPGGLLGGVDSLLALQAG